MARSGFGSGLARPGKHEVRAPLTHRAGDQGLTPGLSDVAPEWQDLINFDQQSLKGMILFDEKSHLLWF